MPEVTLSAGPRFTAAPGDSILVAAAKANVALPYSCKTGRCSTCKCKVLSGSTLALHPELGITDEERAEGWILSCVRSALTDVVIEAEDLGAAGLPLPRTLPCRVHRIEKLAPDIIAVKLRMAPTSDFVFSPGQYIDVIGAGGVRRSYSLANAVATDKLLELHIRAVEDGLMSRFWFETAKPNDLLRLHGPLGTFFLRDSAGMDLIFLCTGTGMAPVKAMLASLRGLADAQRPRSVRLFWGGRVQSDLYFDVGALLSKEDFTPVLSREGSAWTGARGHVQDALLAQLPTLGNAAVYACGSAAMIHAAREALVGAGLARQRFYSDAFVCSGTN